MSLQTRLKLHRLSKYEMKFVNEFNRNEVHFAKFANTSFLTLYTLFMLVKNNSECNSKKK